MYLDIFSHRGHFNLCDPSEESISTNIKLRNSDTNETVKVANIDTEEVVGYEDFVGYSDFNAVEIVDGWIEEWIKKTWISTSMDKVKEFRDFMNKNKESINQETLAIIIKRRKDKLDKIKKEIKELESFQLELA